MGLTLRAIIDRKLRMVKGAPAQDSHTSTWLVSPAAGHEKKKDTSRTKPQAADLSMSEVQNLL